MTVPALSLTDAAMVAAPAVAPTITVMAAVPLASVRAVRDRGLNKMSKVDVKVMTLPAITAPVMSIAVALTMAGLSG